MVAFPTNRLFSPDGLSPAEEALAAQVTQAAYDIALRHSPDQPFTDLQLALWREIRAVIAAEANAGRLSR